MFCLLLTDEDVIISAEVVTFCVVAITSGGFDSAEKITWG